MTFAPKRERFNGGIQLLKRRAPILGGSFALWGGLFSMTDCLLMHLRNKQDYINPIVAGAFTGGFLAVRGILIFIIHYSWCKNSCKKCNFWRSHFRYDSISWNWNVKTLNERRNEKNVSYVIIINGWNVRNDGNASITTKIKQKIIA